MENEVWAIHYDGELLRELSGMRVGAVYCRKTDASRRRTIVVKQWKKYGRTEDPTKLQVVRYVPEVRNG